MHKIYSKLNGFIVYDFVGWSLPLARVTWFGCSEENTMLLGGGDAFGDSLCGAGTGDGVGQGCYEENLKGVLNFED